MTTRSEAAANAAAQGNGLIQMNEFMMIMQQQAQMNQQLQQQMAQQQQQMQQYMTAQQQQNQQQNDLINGLVQNQQNQYSRSKRGDPPNFQGKQDEDLNKWIFLTEDYYTGDKEFEDAESERFVIKVSSNLQKNAMNWYHGYATKAKANSETRTWTHFKVAIRKQYEKVDPDYQVMIKMARLRQKGAIMEHNAEFQALRSQISKVDEMSLRFWYTESLIKETKQYVLEHRATGTRGDH